ncbi:MAG TPA: hypothetical protein VFB45_04995 [Pseudolabrys sp.]|nr:hypothetical protein [Pseudolabrys sp.]
MLTNETTARSKWCPFVRIDNGNRFYNTMTDGFVNTNKLYHCLGSECMGWREFHMSHVKGNEDASEQHGYCGFAGRPTLE